MSFSADVKAELSKINNLKNKQEVQVELLGYLTTINISQKKGYTKFSTESEYNINRFAKLLNNMNINDYDIEIQGKNYIITYKSNMEFIENDLIEKINTDSLKKAFIRGNFMGSGSVNEPSNQYHLEILYTKAEIAKFVKNLLETYNINVGILDKEKSVSIYIKGGEEISKFLALIGANSAVLKFEEIRVMRDMKNNVNRIVNCETANLNKTIGTSVEQINIIKELKKNDKYESLPEDLKEIAIVREENPNATLEEIGQLLKKPIGKSSVSYRFKKLKELVDKTNS